MNNNLRTSILLDRSHCLQLVRSFFLNRGVVEVDCPLLTRYAPVDEHIDLIETKEQRFLSSSPEYLMKRLLCEGMPDLYQLGHVYRAKEAGKKHNPEFTLLEWYRKGFTFEQMIEETLCCLALLLGEKPVEKLTYREAFLRTLSIDPLKDTKNTLLNAIEALQIAKKEEMEKEPKDTLLQLLLGYSVEPLLGQSGWTVLYDFPASQAALAKIDGAIAKRFEIYLNGVELANGYDEEPSAKELRKRFEEANEKRKAAGKPAYPLDLYFLKTLKETPLPPTCGVAVGFDRLLMLRHKTENIEDVLPFSWQTC
jgi:lysyl-tRNA synthetase class 2